MGPLYSGLHIYILLSYVPDSVFPYECELHNEIEYNRDLLFMIGEAKTDYKTCLRCHVRKIVGLDQTLAVSWSLSSFSLSSFSSLSLSLLRLFISIYTTTKYRFSWT